MRFLTCFGYLLVVAALVVMEPAVAADENSWPMYGKNLQHTFANPGSQVTPANVATLQPAWIYATRDAVSASPAIVDGVLYDGSWDGFFFALDAHTGALKWRIQLDCQASIVPLPEVCGGSPPPWVSRVPDPARFQTAGGIVTASPAVVGDRVYFSGGKTLYSVRAADGAVIWKHVFCGNPEAPDCQADAADPAQILTSPAVFRNLVFIGIDLGGNAYGQPYRGAFVAIDASTGQQVWRFETDPLRDAHGKTFGGQNRGCGGVWSSPAVDEEQRIVVFGTADCDEQPKPPYHGSVLALDTDRGRLRRVFRPIASDPYKCDFDVGAAPNVIKLGPFSFVGVGDKNGTYYLLTAARGQLVWGTRVVFGGGDGGFFGGAAFDGRRLFSATAFGDGNPQTQTGLCNPGFHDPSNPNVVDTYIQDPSMHAFDLLTGEVLWEADNNQSFGATTLANGVVLSGFTGLSETDLPAVKAYAAQTSSPGNQLLAVFPTQVNGVPGIANSAIVPVGRSVYFGSGNYFDGGGGGVQALQLPSDAASK
jgi:polyvinyl alcohol dehydrogenase (cytochrome)